MITSLEPQATLGTTVLYVDIKDYNRVMFRYALDKLPQHVQCVATQDEALSFLDREIVSILVVAVSEREMSNVRILEEARSRWPQVVRAAATTLPFLMGPLMEEKLIAEWMSKPWGSTEPEELVTGCL